MLSIISIVVPMLLLIGEASARRPAMKCSTVANKAAAARKRRASP